MFRRALALAGATLMLGTATAAADTVQPGSYHVTGDAGCTLNFIYDGGGGPYVGTAAHCVDSVGQQSFDGDGLLIGTVAAIGDEGATATDWALIRIDPSAYDRIVPGLRGHPGLPSSSAPTTPSETATLSSLVTTGYGLGFQVTALTREQRPAFLTYDDTQIYTMGGAAIFGDSGGPVVHGPTGRPLGIISRLCVGACEEEGPTVQGIVAQAAAQGLAVSVRH